MTIPILAFDFDGTLLDPQGRIHPGDAQLLASLDPRVRFILATGRSLESVRTTFARNNMFLHQRLSVAMVLQNGALCLMPGEEVVQYISFGTALQERLINLVQSFPAVTTLFFSQTDIHMLHPTDFGLEAADLYGLPSMPLNTHNQAVPFSKVMCLSDNSVMLAEIQKATRHLSVEGCYSMPTIFEIAPPGVSKATGLKVLTRALGYDGAPVYAAGDGENDLDMLRMASLSFTPTTSRAEIQTVVDLVIDTLQCGLLKPMMEAAGVG